MILWAGSLMGQWSGSTAFYACYIYLLVSIPMDPEQLGV